MAELAHRIRGLPMAVTQAGYDIAAIHAGIGDLAGWISQHCNVAVGARSGADTAIECPQHRPGHTTSATVHRWPDGRQTFKCWRCDIGPVDVIDLAVEMREAASRGDAIRQLAELVGASKVEGYQPKKRAVQRPQQRKLVQPIHLDPNQIDTTQAGRDRVLAYCQWRGWSPQTANYFRLRSVRRFDGWRIRHPFLNLKSETLAAQDYKRSANQRWISAKGSTLTLFGLQNLRHVERTTPIVDVCEGISDCITLTAAMRFTHAAVGAPGAASWRTQYAEALYRYQIIVWPDNDDARTKFARSVTDAHTKLTRPTQPVAVGRIPEQYADLTEWQQANPKNFVGDFRVARHDAWRNRWTKNKSTPGHDRGPTQLQGVV